AASSAQIRPWCSSMMLRQIASQAAAALIAAGVAEPHETLEDPLPLARRHTGSLIFEADAPHAGAKRGPQGDDAVSRRGAEGVRQQVEEHLTDTLRLEGHQSFALTGQHEAAALVLGEHARILREDMEEAGRVLWLQLQRDGPCLGARQEEQLLDDPVETRQLLQLHLHGILLC